MQGIATPTVTADFLFFIFFQRLSFVCRPFFFFALLLFPPRRTVRSPFSLPKCEMVIHDSSRLSMYPVFVADSAVSIVAAVGVQRYAFY